MKKFLLERILTWIAIVIGITIITIASMKQNPEWTLIGFAFLFCGTIGNLIVNKD